MSGVTPRPSSDPRTHRPTAHGWVSGGAFFYPRVPEPTSVGGQHLTVILDYSLPKMKALCDGTAARQREPRARSIATHRSRTGLRKSPRLVRPRRHPSQPYGVGGHGPGRVVHDEEHLHRATGIERLLHPLSARRPVGLCGPSDRRPQERARLENRVRIATTATSSAGSTGLEMCIE
jgi:hypothetical protein